MNVTSEQLGTAIRAVRKKRGLTLEALAERLDVTVTYLSLLENGKRGVSTDLLNRIGVILKVPASFLSVLGTDMRRSRKPAVRDLVKSTQEAILELLELEESAEGPAVPR